MDDVWNVEAWNGFKSFFPSNGNKSRVVITTRLSNVAESLAPGNRYSIGLLDEDKSWALFREKSLCSVELEEIGKKIAKKCGGLPLALVVIGGLLAKSNGARKYWEIVAENTNSYVESEIEEKCLSILYVSFNHLPLHLQPCFLHMGVFPEDSDIKVNRLIEVAEGIVKPEKGRNMEDVAVEYLEDLISRNMVLVRKLGHRREIKTCGVHDLLRQLCIKESHKEQFLNLPTAQVIQLKEGYDLQNMCFMCGNEGTCKRIQLCAILVGSRSTTTQTSPILCDVCSAKYPQLNGSSRSIKLIDQINNQRVDIPQVTKLRSLSIGHSFNFRWDGIVLVSPSPLCLLWNLQVLYFNSALNSWKPLLSKIWDMPQLRHVHANGDVLLTDPADTNDMNALQHLQMLTGIKNFRCTEEVVKRILNLITLRVGYLPDSIGELNSSYYCLKNLAHLRNLQSLSVNCRSISLDIKSISFPRSLKKLSLWGGRISWEDMSVIGSLPNLEVLKVYNDAFVGDEWCTDEEQFPSLKYLEIAFTDLVIWRSESTHFRVLEKLVLVALFELEEFPLDIGDINTLLRIEVLDCNKCIVKSAKQIVEEQEEEEGDEGV